MFLESLPGSLLSNATEAGQRIRSYVRSLYFHHFIKIILPNHILKRFKGPHCSFSMNSNMTLTFSLLSVQKATPCENV